MVAQGGLICSNCGFNVFVVVDGCYMISRRGWMEEK